MIKTELNFLWKATFEDDSTVSQFNEDGTENKFKIVQDKFDDLTYFELRNIVNNSIINVDLINGFIILNNYKFNIPEDIKKQKHNIRLIYFRRSKNDINIKGEVLLQTISYFIGYQYNDLQGKNCKVLVNIDQDGNMILGDV